MIFIHESPLQYHGALRPSNCLVDARWVVKLADFGLREFRRGELPPSEPGALRAHIEGMYGTAEPENVLYISVVFSIT